MRLPWEQSWMGVLLYLGTIKPIYMFGQNPRLKEVSLKCFEPWEVYWVKNFILFKLFMNSLLETWLHKLIYVTFPNAKEFINGIWSLHMLLLGQLRWAPNRETRFFSQSVLWVSRSRSIPRRFWRRTTAIRFQGLSTTFFSCRRTTVWARPDTNSCVSLLGLTGRSL